VRAFDEALAEAFGPERVRRHAALAPLTTFRVGGPADWLVEPRTSDEILTALRLARAAGVAVSVLGGGSNVLVSDAGVRGLVIRPSGGEVRRLDESAIRADAAVSVNRLVRWTITHACAGLEAWAGTPGTIGGAVFGNAHFSGRLISELVREVRLATRDGVVKDVPQSEMAFAYDRSRLAETGEIVLSVVFEVTEGEPSALRRHARESLAYRRQTQPLESSSAGCVFQNPDPNRDRLPEGVPWSAGALVDLAGLKGLAVGGARVSARHANFIVNEGTATAQDIRALITRCRGAVRDAFGVDLREEVVLLGSW
jgi:UDP-N-acetylmuramate dehydrogenase